MGPASTYILLYLLELSICVLLKQRTISSLYPNEKWLEGERDQGTACVVIMDIIHQEVLVFS